MIGSRLTYPFKIVFLLKSLFFFGLAIFFLFSTTMVPFVMTLIASICLFIVSKRTKSISVLNSNEILIKGFLSKKKISCSEVIRVGNLLSCFYVKTKNDGNIYFLNKFSDQITAMFNNIKIAEKRIYDEIISKCNC